MGLFGSRPSVFVFAIALSGAGIAAAPDLAVQAGAGRADVGALRVLLTGAALAQAPGLVVLENVDVAVGSSSYRAKRVELSGAASTRAEIEALLNQASPEPLAARLARLTAQRITIPELETERRIGDLRQKTVTRNIVARDIRNGRIGSLTADGAATDGDGPQGKGSLLQGRLSLSDLDAAAIARLYMQRTPQPAGMTRILGAFSVDDIRISAPQGAKLSIARLSGSEVGARPVADSWENAVSLVTALSEAGKASDDDSKRLVSAMADGLDAVDVGVFELSGIELRDGKEVDRVGRVGRFAYTGNRGGRVPEVRFEGIEVNDKNGSARIAAMVATGFSLESTIEGLKALRHKPLKDIDASEARRIAPTLGTVRLSGLDFDLPGEDEKGVAPARIRFALKALEIAAGKPVNGMPTEMRVALENLVMPIPSDAKDDGLGTLAAFGYTAIDLSSAMATSWNEAAQELVLREASTEIKDVGRVLFRAGFGNVSKDVFSTDSAVAMVALVATTIKSLDLTVENRGIFQRYFDYEAKKQGKSSEDLRRELGTTLALGMPMLLGNSTAAKGVGQAIARFMAKPGRLTISARAKAPAGLGITDVVGLSEPSDIVERLEITATAE